MSQHPTYQELVLEDRVHGSIYTDSRIFEEEIDRIFHRGWVYVGHESEISGRGDYCTRFVGRQPVILVRGEDDEIRVLMNRCRHRGAVVCPYERGTAKLFTCAYHAWTYRNTGSLLAVPHDERYDSSFDKADYGLTMAPRQATYRGFVFASLAPEGQPFDAYLGRGPRRELDLFTDLAPDGKVLATAGVHKYAYPGNWKLQVENNVDAYHFNFVHKSFWQIMNKRGGVRMDSLGTAASAGRIRNLGNGHVGWDYRPLQEKAGQRAISNHPKTPPWQQEYFDLLIDVHGAAKTAELITASPAHVFVFPNLALIGSQIRVMQPKAVNHTEVFVYPTLLGGAPEEFNSRRIKAHEAFYGPAGGGATDDLEIFARLDTGLHADVDPWVLMARGLGKEELDLDGFLSGQITDELGSRTILHHWRDVMSGIAQ